MTGFPKPVRDLIRARSGGHCEVCGHQAVQVHHRRPRGMGGSTAADTNTAANALDLCVSCHLWIEGYRAEAYRMGWLVRQHHSPSVAPVLWRGEWRWLDDEGAANAKPPAPNVGAFVADDDTEPPWM